MPILKDYTPETRDLLLMLTAAGFTLEYVDNGGDLDERCYYARHSFEEFLAETTAADEAFVCVSLNDRTSMLYLVFGNDPGELVNDYTCDDALEAVITAHSDKWEGKPQPLSYPTN